MGDQSQYTVSHLLCVCVCVYVCVYVCVCVCVFLRADIPNVKENECVAGRIDSYQLKCSEKILLTWLGEVANGEGMSTQRSEIHEKLSLECWGWGGGWIFKSTKIYTNSRRKNVEMTFFF